MECDKYQEQESVVLERASEHVVVVGISDHQQISSEASKAHMIICAPDLNAGLEYAERFQAGILFLCNAEQNEREALHRIVSNTPHMSHLICSELESNDTVTAPLIENLSKGKRNNRWI